MLLGFAKAHYQIPLEEKMGVALKIRGFPFNISAAAETGDFKFGTQIGSAKAQYKIPPKEKIGWSWVRGAYQYYGVL